MTPEEVGTRLGGEGSVSGGGEFARVTVDVPVAGWATAVASARDELGYDFFDWLSAVDELDAGYSLVTHLWSVADRRGLLLRTALPREAPAAPSIVDIYPGAAWHERETHEMFGVVFDGHPGLAPLLLPDGFEGHPLRKDFPLAARAAQEWPGAREPGERRASERSRRRLVPPGVPEGWPPP